jgi:hypothetical protein
MERTFQTPADWKSAIQQVGKPALLGLSNLGEFGGEQFFGAALHIGEGEFAGIELL